MSGIPNVERVIIGDRKLADYLLAMGHPFGRAQARVFLALGFRRDEIGRLRDALRRHAAGNPVVASEETEFGTKYVVEGPLTTPDGREVGIRSVWFVERGEEAPRFVTAYPWKGGIA